MQGSTSAFFWGDGISIINSGSVFFLNTGRKLLAVTARHVYEGYLRASLDRRLLCQLDSLSFDTIQRLVSKGNGAADIATFEVAGHELVGLGKTTLPWPPVKPEIGHAMLVCGVPAVGRSVPFLGKAQFTWYSGMFAVENISDTSMSFIKPPNERLVDITVQSLENLRWWESDVLAIVKQTEHSRNISVHTAVEHTGERQTNITAGIISNLEQDLCDR